MRDKLRLRSGGQPARIAARMDSFAMGFRLAVFAAVAAGFALAAGGVIVYFFKAISGKMAGERGGATHEELAVITAAMHEHLGKKR
ncbi:MAG: hypothetical protein HZA04_08960 [Nitrospinae bacterium]|nr:hypothetical protein [Nitrospinota bacterium]